MRDKIAQYMALCPRNKLIFTPRLDSALKSVDVGYELYPSEKSRPDKIKSAFFGRIRKTDA